MEKLSIVYVRVGHKFDLDVRLLMRKMKINIPKREERMKAKPVQEWKNTKNNVRQALIKSQEMIRSPIFGYHMSLIDIRTLRKLY